MNAGDNMLQRCYREIALLEYWLENPEYDREIAEERGQCSEQEGNVADEITGDKQRNVAEGQEVWEVATSMAESELTKIGNNNNKLDIEIEEIWKLMMQQSKWRKIEIAASKFNQNLNLIGRKKKMEERTTEMQRQQRNKAFGRLQNKVWDPGRSRRQTT